MKVINIDDVKGREITIPGMTRTLKDVLVTKNMTTHLGIIPPGQMSSRHNHSESEEITYVVSGEGMVTAGPEEERDWDKIPNREKKILKPNYMVYVPPGPYHQYRSTGKENLILFVAYSPPAEVPKK